jgi:hypothetical protein
MYPVLDLPVVSFGFDILSDLQPDLGLYFRTELLAVELYYYALG